MKKFLLLVCLSLFSLVSFASNIDTLYFKPGDKVHIPLVINESYLAEENVAWKINNVEIPEGQIVTVDSVRYYHVENGLPEKWDNGKRTAYLTYSYSISPTRAALDVVDTVAVLHIQKQLANNDLEFSFINNELTYYVGDTIRVVPRLMNDTDTLDINTLALLHIDGTDTVSLDYIDKLDTLSFIPEEAAKNYTLSLGAVNLFGSYSSTFSWPVTILPTLELTSLQSTTVGSTETLTTTYEGVDSMTVSVLEGDSLRLVVNTNSNEADIPVSYQWNVDGQGIIADSVYVQGRTLSISKFKAELQGTYNCIITEKDSKKILATASFKVVRQSPTANEMISEATYQVTSENGSIVVKGASNKAIIVTTMTGKVIYNGTSNSDNFVVNVPSASVLVVKVDNQTFKVLSK